VPFCQPGQVRAENSHWRSASRDAGGREWGWVAPLGARGGARGVGGRGCGGVSVWGCGQGPSCAKDNSRAPCRLLTLPSVTHSHGERRRQSGRLALRGRQPQRCISHWQRRRGATQRSSWRTQCVAGQGLAPAYPALTSPSRRSPESRFHIENARSATSFLVRSTVQIHRACLLYSRTSVAVRSQPRHGRPMIAHTPRVSGTWQLDRRSWPRRARNACCVRASPERRVRNRWQCDCRLPEGGLTEGVQHVT